MGIKIDELRNKPLQTAQNRQFLILSISITSLTREKEKKSVNNCEIILLKGELFIT